MKKSTRTIAIILALSIFGAMAMASGSSNSDSGSNGAGANESKATEAGNADFAVTLEDTSFTVNYENAPVIVATYSFTNNSGEEKMFSLAVNDSAYQNGVELDPAYITDTTDGSTTNIQDGTTIEVTCAYLLQDTENPIQIKVTELFGDGVYIDETIEIDADTIGEMTAPDFTIEYVGYTIIEDYQGNPAIMFEFNATNNSSEGSSFMTNALPRVYQNGVELENAISMDDSYDLDGYMANIQPGASTTVYLAYVLQDETSEVQLEVGQVVGDYVYAEETISLA